MTESPLSFVRHALKDVFVTTITKCTKKDANFYDLVLFDIFALRA